MIGIALVIKALKRIDTKDLSLRNHLSKPSSFSKKTDVLAIMLCISFYCIFNFAMYPDATLIPYADTSRHYNHSSILSVFPDLYTHFNYLLFHSYSATLDVLSGMNQKMTDIQTIPILLNLLLPLSIYVLTKRFLSNIDKRIPALATIFYTFFSNLSFIYFAQLKLIQDGSTDTTILTEVAEKSFNGTINFLQPFLYFTPMSAAFLILIISFMLLKVNNLPKIKHIVLYSVLILALNLTHISEGLIFIVILIIYSLITERDKASLNNALVGSLIGTVVTILFVIYRVFVWPDPLDDRQLNFATQIVFILPGIIVATLAYRWKILPRLSKFSEEWIIKIKRHFSSTMRSLILTITIAFTVIFLLGLVIWIVTDDFRYSMVITNGFVPWFIYPMLFGVTGLLAILSLRYLPNIWKNYKSPLVLILIVITISFLLGRATSFINVNIVNTGYWEIRFIMIVFTFMSLLAPIPLIKLIDNVSNNRKKQTSLILISTLVSSIVLLGFSSLMLQSELWYLSITSNAKNISDAELDALNFLKNVLEKDKNAFAIAPSTVSSHMLVFATPSYILNQPDLLTQSKYPDIPLLSLSAYHLDHAYLYLHSRDVAILSKNPTTWLSNHLIRTLPVVFSNDEVSIYNITNVSYPVSDSNSVLVYPTELLNNDQRMSWYVQDILSQSQSGFSNYTVMLDKDPRILKNKNLVLSFDPPTSYNRSFYDDFRQISYNNRDFETNTWSPISGTWSQTLTGLHGETDPGEIASYDSLNNLILSPFFATNLSSVATTFELNDRNRNISIPNYVSIVYSFQDPENYKQTGINLFNNDIYVLFSQVVNGSLINEPAWPGLKTNLKVGPDNHLFDMSLSFTNYTQTLTVNGMNYSYPYNSDNAINDGYVGLSYGRVKSVDFYDFESHDNSMLFLRDFRDYIRYAESGGNLYLIQTDMAH
ncbi:hypothetical protein [Candidatus Nitrosocosmicus franklandus]|nr:hypothetical protein [Candidatus Nitrosocosmicus franklandus]